MNAVEIPTKRISAESEKMARKRTEATNAIHQMSLRLPSDFFKRIEKIAARLGIDATNLVRMILKEKIAEYERRAEQIQ